ncbi:MAG: CDP-paratose 2-epimerase [Planctomycetaceae bacterium]|nr:CDP-paratose 2-epimerase [Planctomycetaceae bacterium]
MATKPLSTNSPTRPPLGAEPTLSIGPSREVPGEFQLVAEQTLPGPRADVFAFFADAFQLERITPAWLHFAVLASRPLDIQTGTLIDYRLRLHGLPLRWKTRIREWEPPFRFVDEQLKGPYRRWHHEHTFLEAGPDTLVRDIVDYRVPGGVLIHSLFVKHDLRRIFHFRQAALSRLFHDCAGPMSRPTP